MFLYKIYTLCVINVCILYIKYSNLILIISKIIIQYFVAFYKIV